MFGALLTMNIFHPGMVLRGQDSKFAKVSKEEKKALKEQKKQEKVAKKNGAGVNSSGVSSEGAMQQV